MKLNFKNLLKSLMIAATLSLFPVASWAGQNEVKACLKQALASNAPVYQVPQGEGTSKGFGTYLAIMCRGDVAQGLYHAIKEEGVPGDWSGHQRGEVKTLGEAGGSSMCYHVTRDSDNQKVDDYSCSIRLGVSEKNLDRAETQDMVPFEVRP